jgi:hypothetical protein
LARIREAKRVLEERARKQTTEAKADGKSAGPDGKAQYNFTDPESRIMKSPDRFVQAYNVLLAVEDTCQLIVGQAVTQEVNDKRQLTPMVEAVGAQTGETPQEIIADNGYCSEANLEYVRDHAIDAQVAPELRRQSRKRLTRVRGSTTGSGPSARTMDQGGWDP